MISPLLARSLATLTMRICASSTSFRRTGPIASMSSRRILPARSLMLEKKTSRSESVAPLSASASLSFSTWRSSVWIEPGSSLPRSSKVNISALMRSAQSRVRSSSAVMKRLSVWRSKLLKISAIVLMRVALGGAREVGHELDAQRLLDLVEDVLLHRFHAQHALHDFQREFFGQRAQHARGMFRLDLGQHDRDGLRIFVLEIVREHRLVHIGELVPHGAAGGTADFLHDLRRPFRPA